MSSRKLQALEYPNYDSFNIEDIKDFRKLIVWLEDQKIRSYKVEQRTDLRNVNSPIWNEGYSKYLKDIPMILDTKDPHEILDWLLTYAIKLEYSDNVDKYSQASLENVEMQQTLKPQMVTANPLDKLDFSSVEFVEGVNSLAEQLQVTKHPNHLFTLEAIAKLVKDKLGKSEPRETPKGMPFPLHLKETDTGFDTGDNVLNQASKILRLIYIHDLRELQTKINETIVAVQSITANPKTDTKLGKVGF